MKASASKDEGGNKELERDMLFSVRQCGAWRAASMRYRATRLSRKSVRRKGESRFVESKSRSEATPQNLAWLMVLLLCRPAGLTV